MGKHFGGSKVKYLTEAERAAYKLSIKDGKLYDANGKLFDTSDAASVFGGGQEKAIFVMDEFGDIFASKTQVVGKFHHSSFLAGKPVAAAGEIEVVDGVIKTVTQRSGHYRPDPEYVQQFVRELKTMGVNTSKINIEAGF